MELMDVINSRRSVRAYRPDMVERESIERILHAAVQAPSGMNSQPWAFGVIQGAKQLKGYSEQIKQFLLDSMDQMPWLAQYQEHFRDPEYNVFYGAPALVIIYARDGNPIASIDCTLAAENVMLAACDMGLGTCWIGFSQGFLDQPHIRQELGVPDGYSVVAPIIVGYPAGPTPAREKNPPEVLFWK